MPSSHPDIRAAGENIPRDDENIPRDYERRRVGAFKIAVAAVVAASATGGAGGAWMLTSDSRAARPIRVQTPAAPPLTDEQIQAVAAARRIQLRTQAARAARKQARSTPAQLVKGTPPPARTSTPRRARAAVPPAAPSGSPKRIALRMLPEYGWSSSQFRCLENLWERESGWNHRASSPTGAYGIPQALPGSKMASAGSDWETNPATQIEWGLGYIKGRYGSPCAAWSHFQSAGWY